MKRLSDNEIFSMERFLIAENEEAVGFEIRIGKDWRSGYSQAERVQRFSLEELAHAQVLDLGRVKVCALAGDRLYCIERGRHFDEVHAVKTEYAYRGVDPDTGEYLYIRVIVLFKTPIALMSGEEIFALETILVKENARVVGVKLEPGSMGIGGTNRSGFGADVGRERRYTAEELCGRAPIPVEDAELCALVGDVAYLRCRDPQGKEKVVTLSHREDPYLRRGEGIGYDTVSATRVTLLLKEKSE